MMRAMMRASVGTTLAITIPSDIFHLLGHTHSHGPGERSLPGGDASAPLRLSFS